MASQEELRTMELVSELLSQLVILAMDLSNILYTI
jgi:hypothetical protein